ncbi:MAG: D-aminoacylase [Gemmatimonadales bacterium]|nr:MAG: D-aminoacylase [Gemmatimonadales bacterium]
MNLRQRWTAVIPGFPSKLLTVVALLPALSIGAFASAPGNPEGGERGLEDRARSAQEVDLILRGGRLLDGSGNPWVLADLAIRGDRIVGVGRLAGWVGAQELDVSGLYVAPGFIDAHSHAGDGLASEDRSHAEPQLAQGVTTLFVNPDGGGPVDLVEQRGDLLEHGLGINVAQLVPHGSIRAQVMGLEDRAPTAEELERMLTLTREGMEAGAFGLSTGPFYAPGSFADTAELAALAAVAAEYGGIHTSHIRDEGDYSIGLVAAVDEVIEVARQTGVRSIVTHVKALGPRVWGYSGAVIRRVELARDEGLEIFTDQYPYNASATSLAAALVPRWAQEGGTERMRERFDDPALTDRLQDEIGENLDRRGGADRIQFRNHPEDPSIEGRTLDHVARVRGLDPVAATLDLLREGGPGIVSFNMDDGDIHAFMRQPWNMIASDGSFPRWGEGVPHPRSYGAFPRVIRKYVQEDGVLTLEDAIRKMTFLPALVHRMDDRGVLRAGAVADVVVFDLDRVNDRATFTDPHQLSEGMVHVFVNGRPAIRDGGFTGERAGRVLTMERAGSEE